MNLKALIEDLSAQDLADLEYFLRAAAVHATSDGVDDWNDMVDAWGSVPESIRAALLGGEQ